MTLPTDPYTQVDEVIEAFVHVQGSVLFREWAGMPARFFYLPGEPPFECFQISIGLWSGDGIFVVARAIDTNDDTELEMEHQWQGATEDLPRMLEAAINVVRLWKKRIRR